MSPTQISTNSVNYASIPSSTLLADISVSGKQILNNLKEKRNNMNDIVNPSTTRLESIQKNDTQSEQTMPSTLHASKLKAPIVQKSMKVARDPGSGFPFPIMNPQANKHLNPIFSKGSNTASTKGHHISSTIGSHGSHGSHGSSALGSNVSSTKAYGGPLSNHGTSIKSSNHIVSVNNLTPVNLSTYPNHFLQSNANTSTSVNYAQYHSSNMNARIVRMNSNDRLPNGSAVNFPSKMPSVQLLKHPSKNRLTPYDPLETTNSISLPYIKKSFSDNDVFEELESEEDVLRSITPPGDSTYPATKLDWEKSKSLVLTKMNQAPKTVNYLRKKRVERKNEIEETSLPDEENTDGFDFGAWDQTDDLPIFDINVTDAKVREKIFSIANYITDLDEFIQEQDSQISSPYPEKKAKKENLSVRISKIIHIKDVADE